MEANTIKLFYEYIGYISAYTNYLILLLFIISPHKIKTSPFYFFFINLIMNSLLDQIVIYFHQYPNLQHYIDYTVPLYAVNNILFLGLFLRYYIAERHKKYFLISILLCIVIVLWLFYVNGYDSWSIYGSSFQSISMITFLLISLRYMILAKTHNRNLASAIYIAMSLLVAFSFSFIVNFLLRFIIEVSPVTANLVYGIKNVFWIVANLVAAYAIYQLNPTRNNSTVSYN